MSNEDMSDEEVERHNQQSAERFSKHVDAMNAEVKSALEAGFLDPANAAEILIHSFRHTMREWLRAIDKDRIQENVIKEMAVMEANMEHASTSLEAIRMQGVVLQKVMNLDDEDADNPIVQMLRDGFTRHMNGECNCDDEDHNHGPKDGE